MKTYDGLNCWTLQEFEERIDLVKRKIKWWRLFLLFLSVPWFLFITYFMFSSKHISGVTSESSFGKDIVFWLCILVIAVICAALLMADRITIKYSMACPACGRFIYLGDEKKVRVNLSCPKCGNKFVAA